MKDFDGKVVAITGAAHGIGRAIALGFAEQGAKLAIFDIDGDALDQTAQEARALGAEVFTLQGDFIKLETIVAAFSGTVDALGPVDVLVNNLGQTARGAMSPFSEAEHDTLDFVLDISLRAAVHCTREVVAGMKERGTGRIVSIASDSAFNGDLGCVDYAAAKSGVLGFTRGLAREIGPFGMTANAICPGPTNTRAMQAIPRDSFERARDAVPMKQICEPEDIANAVLFLASDKARYITGQTLLVNGGRVFH
ncbi:SDR family NAD(P)-dependent oxidoreductase [Thalassorhabdomicrobium marinisediminis]|uniref:Short-chain dehydrogenase n=1 Tax=Thalassorhabdomicrobium marinisediminis TaxID=2170577 RepID=A0A2T7FU90_9RHOB|nr:SDR family NAD(P)-dependent oxidoreductase [Thalassorhabdomicrobium marinisediminis]PVA05737.1 short-chain dehydrogenase [Thalassorhabdomicrobium marinisediminis]